MNFVKKMQANDTKYPYKSDLSTFLDRKELKKCS